jgi:hypothetical protein
MNLWLPENCLQSEQIAPINELDHFGKLQIHPLRRVSVGMTNHADYHQKEDTDLLLRSGSLLR